MRAASAGLARPTAAADIADLLTDIAGDLSCGEPAALSGRPHGRRKTGSAKRRNRHRRHRQLVSRRLRRERYRSSGTDRAQGADRTTV
jgi:hypothetical protein